MLDQVLRDNEGENSNSNDKLWRLQNRLGLGCEDGKVDAGDTNELRQRTRRGQPCPARIASRSHYFYTNDRTEVAGFMHSG